MIALRAATATDVDAVLVLWSTAAENGSRPVDTEEAVRAVLARDSDALILAVDGDAIVGSVIAGFDGWRHHLYRLAVAPERRREGIGRALLDAAEARLRELGATRIDAMVLEGNELGQALWRARGYTSQPDWRRWVLPLD